MSRAEKRKRVSEVVAGRLKRQSGKSPALQSKPELRTTNARSDNVPIANAIKTTPASTSTSWSCDVCNLKMHIFNQTSHLAGMRHQKAVEKLARQSGASIPPPSVPTPIPAGWWECDRCDRAPMKALSRDAHTRSKAHLAAAATEGAARKTRTWYVCVPCDKPVLQQERLSHEAGHGVQTRRNHRDREYGLFDPEDPESSSNHSDTEDEAEWDSDDVDGLLHDIDTQWGSLPHGGAYKESRHYYGPSKYDYY